MNSLDFPSPLLLDPLALGIAAALTAALLAHAALAKFADLALLEQHLSAYGLPFALLGAAARLLPAAELLAAVLVLSPLREAGAALAAALLLAYAGAMAWHRARGHVLDCGCGGQPLPVSWALVLRNLVLAAIAALPLAPAAPRPMGLGDFAVIAAAVLLGTVLYAGFNQILRHLPPARARQSLWSAR